MGREILVDIRDDTVQSWGQEAGGTGASPASKKRDRRTRTWGACQGPSMRQAARCLCRPGSGFHGRGSASLGGLQRERSSSRPHRHSIRAAFRCGDDGGGRSRYDRSNRRGGIRFLHACTGGNRVFRIGRNSTTPSLQGASLNRTRGDSPSPALQVFRVDDGLHGLAAQLALRP